MNKSIKQVIDTEYREFSKYVVEQRAIPSLIDGLKPVQRKVLFGMLTTYKGKKTKVADLGSISRLEYHHGETSAQDAAVSMTAQWNNNVPLFLEHGSFGSRIVPEAAAPRYIHASINPDFYKYFSDFDVMDSRDDDHPEPRCYLPTIPWVMVNGITGIAVGFASSFLPHDPKDLAKACREYIKGTLKETLNIKPTFPHFKGSVELNSDGKWTTNGIITRTKRNTWTISELPIGYDRSKYYNILCDLQDSGAIQNFDDACDDTGFKFVVKVDTATDEKIQAGNISMFKLTKIHSENLTALDEKGNLKVFDNHYSIIKHFCDYRMKKYSDALEYSRAECQKKIGLLMAKINFIEYVIANKSVFSLSKKDLEAEIKSKITDDVELVDKLVSIPIYSFTEDERTRLKEAVKVLQEELDTLNKLTPKQNFLDALKKIGA